MSATNGLIPVNTTRRLSPTVLDHDIGDAGSAVAVREYRPTRSPRAALLWVHGGSFIEGDLDMPESHEVALALADRGIWIVATDYRKATNGVRYPAPVDDVATSWQWCVARAQEQGIRGGSLHLGGASAGACLAASVALRAQILEAPTPASVVLAYPLLHPSIPRLDEAAAVLLSRIPGAVEFSPSDVLAMALNYAGDARLLMSGLVFPGLADLEGLPRTLVIASEHDSLRDSAERFTQSARDARVQVEYYQERGSAHGHLGGVGSLQFARSIERMVQWMLDDQPEDTQR